MLLGKLRDGGAEHAFLVRCACDPSPDGTGGETVVDHIRLFPLRDDVRWTYRDPIVLSSAPKRVESSRTRRGDGPCRMALIRITMVGTDQRNGVNCDQQDGQRSWWPARVGRGRRAHPPRSARCEKRGVRSSQEYGVAELGTDGPARRSSLLSPAWWTGPPPIPRCGPPRATNRMTRSSRRSPPQEAAHGFWIRAWGQREPALQGTGRLSNSARCGVAAQGWIGHPGHSFSLELMLHRTPDPDVGALRWSRARRVGTLRLVQLFPLVKRTPHVVHQRIEQDLGHSAVPRRDDRPFVEAANSCLTRTVRRRDG